MKHQDRGTPSLHRNERGMALAIALFAIVVIGALVAGTAFAGQLEMGGGRSAIATTQASEQAEMGIADAFENWDPSWNTQAVGTTSAAISATNGYNRWSYTVTRLGGVLALITSTGERTNAAGDVLTSRVLGQLARVIDPDVDVDAAVEGMGDVTVGGTSKVSGFDTNPAGWTGGTCTTTLADVPGVKASGNVSTTGAADIEGAPSPTLPYVENDVTVTSQRFQDVYDALVPAVTRTFAGGTYGGMVPTTTAGGTCNKSDLNNWGEPGDPAYGPLVPQCQTFMPIQLFTGNVTINTGRGQGIMIIQGNLRIQGTLIFDGIILATGNIDFHGTGGASSRIYGGLFAANTIDVDDLISITGAPVITYSSCAIEAVLTVAARGLPLSRRGWAQIVY